VHFIYLFICEIILFIIEVRCSTHYGTWNYTSDDLIIIW